jgi:hypothetical protein
MTIDRMTLRRSSSEPFSTSAFREMMAYVANRMMDLQVENLTGATHGCMLFASLDLYRCEKAGHFRLGGR